jgi:SWIM zinc finger
VALADLASKCSCPSRKFPCKHALGLLLLLAGEPGRVTVAEAPVWVTEWLDKRSEAAARKQERAERPPTAPDPQAQARRAEKRAERVLAGVEGLELWMSDLVRMGLAAATARGDQAFQEQAARLVDAQASGLAARVRRLAVLPRSSPDLADRAADALGRLALLTHAFRRLDSLPTALAADVRSLIGWSLDREEVMATGERVTDEWAVVGQHVDDDERFRVQRTWLFGVATGRAALIMQFAAGGAPFPEAVPAGVVFGAELVFWPGAFPVRAVVSRREGQARGLTERLPRLHDLDGLLGAYADALARQPWLDRIPSGVRDVVPALVDASGERFALVDDAGRSVPLAGRALWDLFALAGGHPVDVFGDWDGRAFMPFGAFAEGCFHGLGSGSGSVEE